MGPLRQARGLIEVTEQRLANFGVRSNAIFNVWQRRTVVDLHGKAEWIQTIVAAILSHRLPPCTSKSIEPSSMWSGSFWTWSISLKLTLVICVRNGPVCA